MPKKELAHLLDLRETDSSGLNPLAKVKRITKSVALSANIDNLCLPFQLSEISLNPIGVVFE